MLKIEKLQVGQKLNITKQSLNEGNDLKNVTIGLGWDVNPNKSSSGDDFDADVSIGFLGEDGKCVDTDFLYYNNLTLPFAQHSGDNRDGEGEGDDEQVEVQLNLIPARINKAVIFVTIHDAESNGQTFGMLQNSFIRLVNKDTNEELLRFELDFDADTATALVFGSLIKRNQDWYFEASKTPISGGLKGISNQYVK